MINKLSKQIHENAKNKGFYEGEKNIGEMLCLIHSEISEALEADRKGKHADLESYTERANQAMFSYNVKEGNPPETDLSDEDFKNIFKDRIKDTFEDELADAMIRILDLAGFLNIDLEAHIHLKMQYNSLREHKHGKLY